MQEISRNTLNTILRTFESTSNDETRVNLNAVRLGRSQDGENIVEGCDGHILARHFVVEELPEESVLVDRKGKAKLKTFLNNNKVDTKFLVDYDVETNRNLRVYTADQRDGVILPVVFREYPKTCTVIPKKLKEEDTLEVIFNPELLIKLYKSMTDKERSPKITLKVDKNSNLTPIMVASGRENLGILMPLRG